MEKPLISVLMGIYNCADTLEEAVQCIIDQTYSNWELIMCDDCSKDNTYEVARRIAEKDSRIKVLRNKKNKTLAPTLNICLSEAKGEFVARMDGDDVCAINRFEKELDVLLEHSEYAMVSCHMNLYDAEGIYRIITHVPNPSRESLVHRSQFCHAGCMIRTSVMRELGGYCENDDCKRIEDYDLWVRLYAAGYQGYNIQEALYSMRDDRNALKRRSFQNRMNEAKLKCRMINLLHLKKTDYVYAMMPLCKGAIPTPIYQFAHKRG